MPFFPTVYLCSCAGNVCPETFRPYLISSTCVKVVFQPALNYTAAEGQAASQKGGMLAPSTNASVLRFYANVSGVAEAVWVGETSEERESSPNSSCPALESDGTVRRRPCSDELPFAVVLQMSGETTVDTAMEAIIAANVIAYQDKLALQTVSLCHCQQ